MAEIPEDHALKSFSTTWESIKCVASRALPWVIGAALTFAFLPGIIGLLGGAMIPGVSAVEGALTFASGSFLTGAGVGAIFGIGSGLSHLSEDLREAKDEHIIKARENQAARDRALMERSQRVQQGQSQAASPSANNLSAPTIGLGQAQTQGIGTGQ